MENTKEIQKTIELRQEEDNHSPIWLTKEQLQNNEQKTMKKERKQESI